MSRTRTIKEESCAPIHLNGKISTNELKNHSVEMTSSPTTDDTPLQEPQDCKKGDHDGEANGTVISEDNNISERTPCLNNNLTVNKNTDGSDGKQR